MTLHFPDQVETNVLTIDATDPKSGTAEFKASAIRVERLSDDERNAAGRVAAGGAGEVDGYPAGRCAADDGRA